MSAEKEKIIRNYIEGYNQFDVEKMVRDFEEEIIFNNISNGEVNLSLKGLEAFKAQAEMTKHYFSELFKPITNESEPGNLKNAGKGSRIEMRLCNPGFP